MSYSRPTTKTLFVSHKLPENPESQPAITPTKPKYSRVTISYSGSHLPVSHNVEKELETKKGGK